MIDDLEMHQPAITDAVTLRGCQDLAILKFLFNLSPGTSQILGGDNILTLTVTFSRVVRVSTGADVSPTPSIKQSVMVSGHGRGRGRGSDRDFGVRGSFGGGRGSYGGSQNVVDKRPRQCKHCGRTSLRSVESLVTVNRHSWLMLTLLPLVILLIFMLLQPITLIFLALSL